jgi:hypothetical protein
MAPHVTGKPRGRLHHVAARFTRIHNGQNLTFNPSCNERGEFAVPVTVPKVAGLLTPAAGCPMMTVFGVLKDSARNSSALVSRILNSRKIDASTFQDAEPRIAYRPKLPKVYGAGAAKAAVLNHL